jgi:hypothetical protein
MQTDQFGRCFLVASPQSVRRTTDRRDEFLIVRRGLTPRRIERRTESLRCSMQGRDFLPLITGNEVRQREYTLVAALEATTGIFLLYADAPMSEADPPARSDLLLRCESHPNNKSALTVSFNSAKQRNCSCRSSWEATELSSGRVPNCCKNVRRRKEHGVRNEF